MIVQHQGIEKESCKREERERSHKKRGSGVRGFDMKSVAYLCAHITNTTEQPIQKIEKMKIE